MSLGMRPPQESIRRPTGPSNLAQSMFGSGSMMPMIGGGPASAAALSAGPAPTTGGRIPVSGMPAGNLASLFAEADKMAKQSGGGTMANGQFQPDQKTQDAYKDFKTYGNLYNYGTTFDLGAIHRNQALMGNRVEPFKETPAIRARREQMDLMTLAGKTQSEVLQAMGKPAVGDGGNSAASLAAQKEAEAFLKSLGLG